MPGMTNLPIQLVETSPKLRSMQKQRIKAASITWHDDVQSLPNTALFGIANEFFDALPIDQAWSIGKASKNSFAIPNSAVFGRL